MLTQKNDEIKCALWQDTVATADFSEKTQIKPMWKRQIFWINIKYIFFSFTGKKNWGYISTNKIKRISDCFSYDNVLQVLSLIIWYAIIA